MAGRTYDFPDRQRFKLASVFLKGTLVLFLAGSCTPQTDAQSPVEKGKILARVFEYKLYASDLSAVIPAGITPDDSARRAENFINSWVKEKLLVHKAETNLGNEQKNVEKQLQDYRNSLIIYAYEKELVRQRLDTVVTDEMIKKYYDEHPNDFELKDNIMKVVYVRVDKKAPNISKLKSMIQSERPQDRVELESYCKQFGQNYFLDDNVWLLFDDLLKEVPIVTYNKELFLQNNKFVELADSSSFYFVNIKGVMTRNSHSPLAFEKENIRNIILNQRKREMIEQMHTDLYKEAMENKDIEIYRK
jgi:hypothetical protein